MTPIEAAHTVIETITKMAQEQRPLMLRIVPEDGATFWEHYPKGDARSATTKARWYYHVHATGSREEDEHGHFHLFLHRTQMADDAEIKVMPPQGEDAKAHVTHIIGLSIATSGIPRSWFATNRYVTNEFLYSADDMIAHLDLYNVDDTKEDDLVNRFVTAMVALYREEIADLLRQRDAAQARLIDEHGPEKAYEKASGVEVLASIPIDLDEKISTLEI
ncbi:MAG: hypothetical protein ABJ239_09795 [Erythrobacter sp.]